MLKITINSWPQTPVSYRIIQACKLTGLRRSRSRKAQSELVAKLNLQLVQQEHQQDHWELELAQMEQVQEPEPAQGPQRNFCSHQIPAAAWQDPQSCSLPLKASQQPKPPTPQKLQRCGYEPCF